MRWMDERNQSFRRVGSRDLGVYIFWFRSRSWHLLASELGKQTHSRAFCHSRKVWKTRTSFDKRSLDRSIQSRFPSCFLSIMKWLKRNSATRFWSWFSSTTSVFPFAPTRTKGLRSTSLTPNSTSKGLSLFPRVSLKNVLSAWQAIPKILMPLNARSLAWRPSQTLSLPRTVLFSTDKVRLHYWVLIKYNFSITAA